MKDFHIIAGMFAMTLSLLSSCDKSMDDRSGYSYSSTVDIANAEFTEWVTLAESQMWWDTRSKGQYKAYIEGRNNKGLDQFRGVIQKFPSDKFERYNVRSHLTSRDFYEIGVELGRKGWQLAGVQVYVDASGVARHQAVWLKPKSPPEPRSSGE